MTEQQINIAILVGLGCALIVFAMVICLLLL